MKADKDVVLAAKATREAALEQAKAVSAERSEALANAKQAVTEIGATLKEAIADC